MQENTRPRHSAQAGTPADSGAQVDLDAEMQTRLQVATYLRVPVRTLDRWAYLGTGPRFYRIGRHARYRMSDVVAWLEQQRAD
jgi:excisionase family DNA binding protein